MLSIILRNGAVGFFSLEGKLKTSEMQQRNVILLKEVGKKVHISIIIEFSLLNVRSDLLICTYLAFIPSATFYLLHKTGSFSFAGCDGGGRAFAYGR